MAFHVKITLSDINSTPSRSVIAIGETVLIDSDGKSVILTQLI